MKEKLKSIEEKALEVISKATTSDALEELRIKYLGKKGELTTILRSMGSLSKEERPVMGKLVNDVKKKVEAKLDEAVKAIKEKEKQAKLANEVIDVTLPGRKQVLGNKHPVELTLEKMKDIVRIYNHTSEICFDKDNIYLIAG